MEGYRTVDELWRDTPIFYFCHTHAAASGSTAAATGTSYVAHADGFLNRWEKGGGKSAGKDSWTPYGSMGWRGQRESFGGRMGGAILARLISVSGTCDAVTGTTP